MADIDTNNPKDSDLVSQFPANERSSRLAVQNILSADHEAGNDTTDDGKHKIVRLLVQPTPGGTAGEIKLYSKDKGGGELGLFIVDEAGNEAEIISDEVDATVDQRGLVELATQAETEAGTDGNRAVTPAGFVGALNAVLQDATTDQKGVVELATQAETETGMDGDRAVTPAGLTGALPAIVGPKTLDATGFYTLPDGLLLQWSEVTVNAKPETVNFPTAFSAPAWSVLVTQHEEQVDKDIDIINGSVTASGFDATSDDGSLPHTFFFFALGPA